MIPGRTESTERKDAWVFIDRVQDIEGTEISGPGLANVLKRTLVGPQQGWQGWVMRLFTLGPDGHTPRHSHPWPHVVFVVNGEGGLYLEDREHGVSPGSVAYIPGGAEHQFMNRGAADLSFICIVPEEGDN